MRARPGEEGSSLIIVLLMMLVLTTLVVGTLNAQTQSLFLSSHDQTWNAALPAAEAGIDDYVHRLDQNVEYWQYSSSNLPPDGNGAFSGWVPVPGPTPTGFFRYSANATNIGTTGMITLTSTGKVGNATRSVSVTLRRKGFLDFLYFTNFETIDPAIYVNPPYPFSAGQAQTKCAAYYYAGRDPNCINIYFASADVINGPLQSNDALQILGNPHFAGTTSTGWNGPANHRWVDGNGSGSNPVFAGSGDPQYVAQLVLPPSNSILKAEADPLVGGTGCLYTGPTRITLLNNGTMTVISPFTRQVNAGCGTPGNANGQLGKLTGGSPGATVSVPADGVVFVQSVPTTSTDPNYTNPAPNCPYAANWPYPRAGDITPYGCRDGDLFVSGTLSGQLTLAADHNIVVTGNITYKNGTLGTDVLGLVANNYVEIYHPVDSGGNNLGGSFNNPNVSAAILAVNHSFIFQNWAAGATLGQLKVTGAISQMYRGPVATSSNGVIQTGVSKNYVYDQRLKYLSPPHFIDPTRSEWQVNTWAEVQPAYSS